eukprot:260655_1
MDQSSSRLIKVSINRNFNVKKPCGYIVILMTICVATLLLHFVIYTYSYDNVLLGIETFNQYIGNVNSTNSAQHINNGITTAALFDNSIQGITTDVEYEWCQKILNQYKIFNVSYIYKQQKFVSQYFQDWFIYSSIFHNMKHKGIYVDLAAHTYKIISNTYFLDKCLSWDGLCIEAEEKYMNDLHMRRSCDVINKCIWDKPQNITFMSRSHQGWQAGWAGVKGYEKSHFEGAIEINMTCVTLQSIFDAKNIKHIDYMSLDIEGSELHALKGVNWNKTKIDIMSVETNVEGIMQYLKSLGYIMKKKMDKIEVIVVHKSAKDKIKLIDDYLEKYNAAHNLKPPVVEYKNITK